MEEKRIQRIKRKTVSRLHSLINRRYTNRRRNIFTSSDLLLLIRRKLALYLKANYKKDFNEKDSDQSTVKNEGLFSIGRQDLWEIISKLFSELLDTRKNSSTKSWLRKMVIMKQVKRLLSSLPFGLPEKVKSRTYFYLKREKEESRTRNSSRGPYYNNDLPRGRKDAQNSVIKVKESTLKDKIYDETMGNSKNTLFDRALIQKIENLLRIWIRSMINERTQRARGPAYATKSKLGKFNRQRSLFRPNLNDLIKLLSDILGTEVELEIVQLKYPYHDSNIFAQYLGVLSTVRKFTYGRIKNKIIKKIPVSLSNLNSKTKNKNYVLKGGKKMSTLSAFKFGVKPVPAFDSEYPGEKNRVRPLKQKKDKLLALVSSPSNHIPRYFIKEPTRQKIKKLAKSNNILGKSLIISSKSKLLSISKVKSLKRGPAYATKEILNLKTLLSLAKRKEQARLNKRLLIASRLTGIKVRIAGRLARQRVVPKRTVKTTYKGAISRSINNLVDSATFTDKNKKGAFSIRVWLSHRIKK
jgi:Mitochondrial ribosomal protein (VAR1)